MNMKDPRHQDPRTKIQEPWFLASWILDLDVICDNSSLTLLLIDLFLSDRRTALSSLRDAKHSHDVGSCFFLHREIDACAFPNFFRFVESDVGNGATRRPRFHFSFVLLPP